MNPQVDAFLSKAVKWQPEMKKLRKIILDFPLSEELKWYKPCYSFQENNVVIIQPFKEYCALMFCKGALLKDAKKILVKPGENTQAARQIRFTNLAEITQLESFIKSYLREAIEVQKAGLEVEYKKTSDYKMPEELKAKLDKDAAFKKAFNALTPGRQRGYFLYFSTPKQSKTRESRIEKCMPQIVQGKGWNDR